MPHPLKLSPIPALFPISWGVRREYRYPDSDGPALRTLQAVWPSDGKPRRAEARRPRRRSPPRPPGRPAGNITPPLWMRGSRRTCRSASSAKAMRPPLDRCRTISTPGGIPGQGAQEQTNPVDDARAVLERIAKEARKYGISLARDAAAVRPGRRRVAQCGGIIVMRLNNERGQARVRSVVPEGARGLIDAIPALRNRERIRRRADPDPRLIRPARPKPAAGVARSGL